MKDEIQKYLEAQEKWLKNSGVKEEDKVLIVGALDGWDDFDQASTVGMVGTVTSWRNLDEDFEGGVLVRFGQKCPCGNSACEQGYYYPFYLLAKVEEND